MAKPRIVTTRTLIREVALAWRKQYPASRRDCEDKHAIWRKLKALDLETCSAKDVEALIGNRSWTRSECDGCGKDVDAVAVVGQPEDCESSTARLCQSCLLEASDALTKAVKEAKTETKGATP